MTPKPITGGFAVMMLCASTALAHSGATGIVKDRMDAMKSMADTMKSLAAITKGAAPHDPDEIRIHARDLQQHSGDQLTRMYPEGSVFGPSEAAPAIWRDWDGFTRIAGRLSVLAQGLEAAAGNGMAGSPAAIPATASVEAVGALPVDTVFLAITETCKSCHQSFRIDK